MFIVYIQSWAFPTHSKSSVMEIGMPTAVTVFTAAYNYGEYLYRVYESLKAQDYRFFEWLIVDDCSTDNTQEIVGTWMKEENSFPIRYYRQPENKGKMAAMNRGVKEAKYDLFVSIDADDSLKYNALSIFIKH